jgi:S1-C subfamily serine protease
MMRLTRQRGVPVIDVDGQAVVGFNQPLLKQLLAKRQYASSARPPLGLRIKDVADGIKVGGVRAGSRAAQAGVRDGDLIERLNGALARADDLERASGPLNLTVRRGAERLQITV